MKKKLALLTAIPLTFAALTFAGCNEEVQKAQPIILCNFEQFEPDFQLMRLQNEFGAVNVNKDSQYVKSGTTSAKLQPIGGYSSGSTPYAYIHTTSERFDYDYSDFTKVKSVSMWVYNAQETKEKFTVGLVGEIATTSNCTTISVCTYALESGWNKVVTYLDHDKLAYSCDITNIQGVYFSFKNAHVRDPKDGPTYYLDDVTLNMFETPIKLATEYELAEGEIADFEKDYQKDMILLQGVKETSPPEAYVVKATDEGITASSGENVLKVVARGDETASWGPGIVIPQKIMEASGFSAIPEEEWGNYQFCFDVYMTTSVPTDIRLESMLYSTSGAQGKQSVTTKLGEWSTHKIAFSNCGYYPNTSDDRIARGTTNIIKKPKQWVVKWSGFTLDKAEEKVFYLDNFRFEKISNASAQ
jgi:hypothetical protein